VSPGHSLDITSNFFRSASLEIQRNRFPARGVDFFIAVQPFSLNFSQ
jgi:hypothetical protein